MQTALDRGHRDFEERGDFLHRVAADVEQRHRRPFVLGQLMHSVEHLGLPFSFIVGPAAAFEPRATAPRKPDIAHSSRAEPWRRHDAG